MKLKQNIHNWKEKAIDFFFHLEKSNPVDINCEVRCRIIYILNFAENQHIFTLFMILNM